MNDEPLVSVIMNCYNSEKYLREAIESVYAQTYANWEIIFWDNGSTDKSAFIAKSYDSKLKYFKGEQTVSLGEARNFALSNASGVFLAFLDCDDVWSSQKLEKQVPLFLNDNKVGLVFSDVIKFNEKDRQLLYSTIKYYTGYCFEKMVSDYFILMPSVVVRKDALNTLDYWFDNRFSYIEEADFFRRISLKWKLAMVNEPLAFYRFHSNNITAKNYDLSYHETMIMLAQYAKTIPGFNEKYQREAEKLKITETILYSYYLWKKKAVKQARQYLRPYMLKNLKAYILYWMTFVPEDQVKGLITKFRKNKIEG